MNELYDVVCIYIIVESASHVICRALAIDISLPCDILRSMLKAFAITLMMYVYIPDSLPIKNFMMAISIEILRMARRWSHHRNNDDKAVIVYTTVDSSNNDNELSVLW